MSLTAATDLWRAKKEEVLLHATLALKEEGYRDNTWQEIAGVILKTANP